MGSVNRRVERFFTLLDETAKFSNHPQHRISSAIVVKNKLVGLGFNQMKTDPFQKKYSKNDDCIYIHAEIHAIKNALRSVDVSALRYADLYVTRIMLGSGTRGMAKPCDGCMGAIVEFGIRRVFYTNPKGHIVEL